MNVISREVKLYKRSGQWIIGILTPFILVICLGVAITGNVHSVPVGLVSNDNTASNQINQIFSNDSSMNLHQIKQSEINNKIESGQYRAIISVTSVSNKHVNITLYVDSTDTAIKEQVKFSLTSELYQGLSAQGYSVTITTHELYSGKSFFAYLMPSILVLGPVMGGLFGATETILNEKEDKTIENVIVAGFKPLKFAVQKILSFVLTTSITMILTFILVIVLAGSIPTLTATILAFVLMFLSTFIFIAFGITLSTYFPNREVAGVISGTILFPIIFISGAFLSIYSMVSFIIPFAQFNPVTICIQALRTVLLRGGNLAEIIPNILLLGAIALVFFLFAVYRMNKIINTIQK